MNAALSAVTRPAGGFFRGFSYPLRSVGLFRQHPGLLRYVAIPFVINLLVFSLSVYFGSDLFQWLLDKYVPGTDHWYGLLLYYLAWIVAMLLTMVIVFFSFTVVGNLIASPFNEFLSERVEILLAGPLEEERFTFGRILSEVVFALLVELKKLTLFLVCMLLLFSINFVPGLGPLIYAVLAPLLTVFFLIVEYMAFVLMRKRMTFARQRRYIMQRPLTMLGFGCGVLCLLAIPFVQFFCIPLAVVGATRLWVDFPEGN